MLRRPIRAAGELAPGFPGSKSSTSGERSWSSTALESLPSVWKSEKEADAGS
jgi:hypothetical protein